MNKKRISLLISITITLLIFSMSIVPGQGSGNISSGFTGFVKNLLDSVFVNNQVSIDLLHRIIRKGAHVFEYFILGISYFFTGKAYRLSILKVLSFGLLTASIDELIQTFIPERAGRLVDVLVFDFGGFLLAFSIMLLLFNRPKKYDLEMILRKVENKTLSPQRAYREIYYPKQRLTFTNRAHFVKLKIHMGQEKGVNIFLKLLFMIPFPIIIVKMILRFLKRNITNDITNKDLSDLLDAKGSNISINAASGEQIGIKIIWWRNTYEVKYRKRNRKSYE